MRPSPCAPANSSATNFSVDGRWSCKSHLPSRTLEIAQSRAFQLILFSHSDVLHPNRANVSKDELRSKLAELYKANKDQVNVFGFRTQYGGGKSTGFALIYDSHEAMKKFEPHYRLVRIGAATKIEKASRQQSKPLLRRMGGWVLTLVCREATQEQIEGTPGCGEDEECEQGQEEMSGAMVVEVVVYAGPRQCYVTHCGLRFCGDFGAASCGC